MSEKPNCFECEYRGSVPGDAHSRCNHPKVGDTNLLNVEGNPIGISRGWFNWPFNFDPTWLLNCDGFDKKE